MQSPLGTNLHFKNTITIKVQCIYNWFLIYNGNRKEPQSPPPKQNVINLKGGYFLLSPVGAYEKNSASAHNQNWSFLYNKLGKLLQTVVFIENTSHKNIVSVLSGLSCAVPSCCFLNRSKRAENTLFKSFILHLSVSVSDYQTPPFIIKGIKTSSSQPQGNKASCCHRNKLHWKTSEGVKRLG